MSQYSVDYSRFDDLLEEEEEDLLICVALSLCLERSSPIPRRRCMFFKINFSGDNQYLVNLAIRERSFLAEYRLESQSFDILVQLLGSTLQSNHEMANLTAIRCQSEPISAESRIAAALIMLAGGRYVEAMRTHGFAKSTVYSNLHDVVAAINSCPQLDIRYDIQAASVSEMAEGFKGRSQCKVFEYCCGAIDGLAIKIKCPKKVLNQCHYYSGSKKFYCLNMQAVCDANCLFTGVSLRHVGSTNDYVSFQNSSLSQIAASLPYPYHWIGDAAYVDSAFMMTPYPGVNLHETYPPKDWFNFWHSQIRITIERTFGIFVARWGILWKPLEYPLEQTVAIVQACCRLHNFAVRRNIPIINNIPENVAINQIGVLQSNQWRDVIPFENALRIRTGNYLKDYLLCIITQNHYSHDR
jgi:hypothetical protein